MSSNSFNTGFFADSSIKNVTSADHTSESYSIPSGHTAIPRSEYGQPVRVYTIEELNRAYRGYDDEMMNRLFRGYSEYEMSIHRFLCNGKSIDCIYYYYTDFFRYERVLYDDLFKVRYEIMKTNRCVSEWVTSIEHRLGRVRFVRLYYAIKKIRFYWRVYKRRQRRKRAELISAVEKGEVLYDLPIDVSRLIVSWY
jgi:hypothetical protein